MPYPKVYFQIEKKEEASSEEVHKKDEATDKENIGQWVYFLYFQKSLKSHLWST